MITVNATPNEREALVSKYISTPEGRKKLAAAMIQPLRTRVDYKNRYRYNCDNCHWGWNEENHVHDDVECLLARVHES